jgi:hypothetical protein
MAIGFFEYYDPDTGLLHLWGQEQIAIGASTSDTMAMGLPDSTFTDPKMKILSITWQTKIFADNHTLVNADNNIFAFNFDEAGQTGLVLMGIQNENAGTINDLNDFEGTSAWPVEMKSFAVELGSAASVTKTWRPDKLALSDQQQAFLSIRTFDGGSAVSGIDTWSSIYIRGVRL